MRAVTGSLGVENTTKVPNSTGQLSATIIPVSAVPALLEALGGADNVVEVKAIGERLSFRVKDASATDEKQVKSAGFRGIADLGQGRIQVLAGGDASVLVVGLDKLL
jgi:phosphotransferase system IIB component